MKGDNLKTKTGLEMRAQAAERAQQADPAYEAKRHEASFLKHITNARDDYDWIVTNKAWTQLGFETHTDWYVARVHPLMLAIGARPAPELADSILDHIDEDEVDTPGPQRMTQAEKAALTGLNRKTIGRRAQDPPQGTLSPGSDLADSTVVDPLSQIPAAERAVNDFITNQTSPGTAGPGNGVEGATGIRGPVVPSDSPADSTGGVPVDEAPSDSASESGASTGSVGASSPANGSGQSTPADQPEPSDTAEDDSVELRAGAEEGRPEQDHRDAIPGETAEDASSANDSAGGNQADREASAPSGSVNGRQQQEPTAVSEPAAAAPKLGETEEQQRRREHREMRERNTLSFSEGLAAVSMRLDPDPIAWFEEVYLRGVYKLRDMPRVRDCFTPDGIRASAERLVKLAAYLDETGTEL